MTTENIHGPDEPLDDEQALAVALQTLAPPVNDSGVWPSLQPRVTRARRRRDVTRMVGVMSFLLIAGLATWQGARMIGSDQTADRTPVTHPVAPDGGTETTTTVSSSSGGIILPTDTADPRVDAIRRFVNALSAGDTATAWTLLDAGSQKALGTEEALAGISSDLGRQWATSTDVQYQVIDGEPYTGKHLAVVTLFGTVNLAGRSSGDLTTFQVMTGDDGQARVALAGYQAPNGYSQYEWLQLTVPVRPSGTALTTEDALKFVVPTEEVPSSNDASLDAFEAIRKTPGPIVLAVDGVLVGPGQWQEKDGRGSYLPQYSGPGDHVVTLVQFQDDGYVNVVTATYTVGHSPAASDTTLPRTPAGVTPYHQDDGATQIATESLNAYLTAVRDGDKAAFAATLYPLDKSKASDLFAGERALYKDNGDQAFLLIADSIRYNWWQDGGWFSDWAPYHPTDATLSAIADWLQGRPPARFVAVATMADGSVRIFAFEIGDGVKLRATDSLLPELPTAIVTTSGTAATTVTSGDTPATATAADPASTALNRAAWADLRSRFHPTTVLRVQLTGPSRPDVFLTGTDAEAFATALVGGTFDESSALRYSPTAEIVITYTFPGDQVFSPNQWPDGSFEVSWGGRQFLVQSPELARLLQESGFTYQ